MSRNKPSASVQTAVDSAIVDDLLSQVQTEPEINPVPPPVELIPPLEPTSNPPSDPKPDSETEPDEKPKPPTEEQLAITAAESAGAILATLDDSMHIAESGMLSVYREAILTAWAPHAARLWHNDRVRSGMLKRMLASAPHFDPSTLSMAIRAYQILGHDAFMVIGSLRGYRAAVEAAKVDDTPPETPDPAKIEAEKRRRAIRHLQESLSAIVKAQIETGDILEIVTSSLTAYLSRSAQIGLHVGNAVRNGASVPDVATAVKTALQAAIKPAPVNA